MELDSGDKPTFEERMRARLRALQSRDPEAIAAMVGRMRSPGEPWQGELRGLLLRGRRGDKAFAADNPWDVPADAALSDALRHVWKDVAGRCPQFVDTVVRETLGLALVWEADQYLLGYLYFDRLDSPEPPPPADLDQLSAKTDKGWIDGAWGGPPIHHAADLPVGALNRPVPSPIRDLARIHSSLDGFEGSISLTGFDTTLGGRFRERNDWEDHPDADEIRAGTYDRYVHLAFWPPGTSSDYLNLDDLDSSGDPRVSTYAGQDHWIDDSGTFFEWFDRCAPAYLFNLDDS